MLSLRDGDSLYFCSQALTKKKPYTSVLFFDKLPSTVRGTMIFGQFLPFKNLRTTDRIYKLSVSESTDAVTREQNVELWWY